MPAHIQAWGLGTAAAGRAPPPSSQPLRIYTCKRDHTAKARFCVGGHRQLLGRDCFPNKYYCAVLTSRDNRILLALAAVEGWTIYQADIVQAF